MATDLIEIDSDNPSSTAIDKAAVLIRRGGVVAIPSDALYMLIADPMNLQAVGRVFKAKGRESSRSLPLLVPDIIAAEELAAEVTSRFYLLARHFWPGPLTIIVPAAAKVPLKVTGMTGRLGLRQSEAPAIQKLLEAVGHPVIGTSANISGQPTSRTGIEVFASMDGAVDLVLDGGLCAGQGATTVDITEPYWKVIKQGSVTEKDLEECLKG